MMRYINADALLSTIGRIPEGVISDYDGGRWDVAQLVKEAPTADVVEVVRCKYCKYYDRGVCYHPTVRYVAHDADHYCGYGEKRGNDEIH